MQEYSKYDYKKLQKRKGYQGGTLNKWHCITNEYLARMRKSVILEKKRAVLQGISSAYRDNVSALDLYDKNCYI